MKAPMVLLDSYAAKTCPYALHLDRVAPASERLGFSDAAQERIDAGIAFEVLVGDQLASLGVDVAAFKNGRSRDDDPDGWEADRNDRLEATIAAIERGASLIWNPRLPADVEAHRSGEPDLLIRTSIDGPARYAPVDVKAHHALLSESRNKGGSLGDMIRLPGRSLERCGVKDTSHREDLLQLAHYWRMLEAIDRAPSGDPHGGIIGWSGRIDGEPIVGWFDLRSTMGEYGLAFDGALAVVERAVAIAAGAPLPGLGRPWYFDTCNECGWRGRCGPELLEVGHVSLVRPNRRIRPEIESLGIETIDALADLDPTTLGPDGRTLGETAAWLEAIARARMARAGDPTPFSFLDEVGGADHPIPLMWRRADAPSSMGLSRRDVELDVDMESAPSGVYLWGTLLTYPGGTVLIDGFTPGYRGFGKQFDAPGDGTTAAVFLEFLGFIEALRAECDRLGLTFGAYCYAGPSAEEPAMRRCAAIVESRDGASGVADRVEQLLRAPYWIDLLDEIRARVQSLNGLGLKVVGRATGFEWRTEDAGGEASMRWYGRATEDVDPVVRAAYRRRILEYNEDDVAATRHLREWFDLHGGNDVPPLP